ncbi:hypothetical protein PAESOLCIP111_03885 [Paenibacillus solanacearum]|uniref:VCBS repeat-containing protein n=1 Tax=Paenibacillus solanacearum TaxID=2048548 RepID=A0A916K754_9BACL|nr:hypothetical protein [Paenibacillus solanacearum]CAG7637839.1 hypothetical protein PAESOLCIP111_03885 [Paenibacillus solanacearum]
MMNNGLARPAQDYILLDSKDVDVTGDRLPDRVSLYGQKYSPDTVYFKQLAVEVTDRTKPRPIVIPVPGGYNPTMQFCDFTGDRVADIYVTAETGGSAGTSDHYLYTVLHHVPRQLPVPQPLGITGRFEDGYRATIAIKESNQRYTIDLSDRKAAYDQAGYYRDGKLLTPTNVLPNAYSVLRPVRLDPSGVCGLYGVQRIAGFYNADTIAYVTSLWRWQHERWLLLEAALHKAS